MLKRANKILFTAFIVLEAVYVSLIIDAMMEFKVAISNHAPSIPWPLSWMYGYGGEVFLYWLLGAVIVAGAIGSWAMSAYA